VDNTTLQSATLTLTNHPDGSAESLAVTIPGGNPITASAYNSGTGVLTLTGNGATLAQFQTVIQSAKYNNTSNTPNTANRDITTQVNDGSALNADSAVAHTTLTVTPTNDSPTPVSDSYSGAVGNTKAVLGATASPTEPKVTLSGMSGQVPLANDTDPEGDTISVVANNNIATTGGGTVDIATDGKFTYIPGVGDKNQNDTFQYQVKDSNNSTAFGTVTVGIDNQLVWYVNGSAASEGDGRSTSPLKTLAGATTATGINGGGSSDADGSGDYIFVYGPNTYTGGLPLEASQKLVGSPQGLDVTGHAGVAPASGTNPTITGASNVDAIQLANDTDITRTDITGSTGTSAAVRGSAITNATIGSNTTMTGGSAGGLILSGAASGAISVAATISNSGGNSVNIQNRSGGTATLSGPITDTGS
jgi:hypothetical protein